MVKERFFLDNLNSLEKKNELLSEIFKRLMYDLVMDKQKYQIF